MARGRKTGGRAKGTPNKRTAEVRVEIADLARALIEDPAYRAALTIRLLEGRAGQVEPLLFHYAYGKPAEMVLGPGPHGEHLHAVYGWDT